MPSDSTYPYVAIVRTFGHMDEPVEYPAACLRWYPPRPMSHQDESTWYAFEPSCLLAGLLYSTASLMKSSTALEKRFISALKQAFSLTPLGSLCMYSSTVIVIAHCSVAGVPFLQEHFIWYEGKRDAHRRGIHAC